MERSSGGVSVSLTTLTVTAARGAMYTDRDERSVACCRQLHRCSKHYRHPRRGGTGDFLPSRRGIGRIGSAQVPVREARGIDGLMPFNLEFPTPQAENYQLQLNAGEVLFVLGANGTGKSSLMFRFSSQNRGRSRRISAHRQTWMNSDALDMTPSAKLQTERDIQSVDGNTQSRYRDQYAARRASVR